MDADDAWIPILLPHAVILALGFFMLWVASRWPRAATWGWVGCLTLGFTSMGFGLLVETESNLGVRCLQTGIASVGLLGPACVFLIGGYQMRRRNLPLMTRDEWGGAVFGYWLLCWVILVGAFLIDRLNHPPPGGFR